MRAILPGPRARILLRLLVFAVVSSAALFFWRWFAGHLPVEERAVLLLLMLAVGFWTSEAIPAFAVALFIIGYLVFVLGTTIDFVRWMAIGVPPALALVVLAWAFLCWRHPAARSNVVLDFADDEAADLPQRRERLIVSATALITAALWMTTPLHGIHAAAISLIPIVALSMTQVLTAERVRSIPWDTLMLIAGGLSLGEAVVDTGLATRLASGLDFLRDFQSPLPGLVVLAMVTVIASNFMSNTASRHISPIRRLLP